jgi:uncharacterized protein YceH (UPF0502 family)
VLLLRGPQTPGELRVRTKRFCTFEDTSGVERTLHGLATRADGPFVTMLPPEVGRRESRYAHRFSAAGGHATRESTREPQAAPVPPPLLSDEVDERLAADAQRLGDLEQVVKVLQQAIEDIRDELRELRTGRQDRY